MNKEKISRSPFYVIPNRYRNAGFGENVVNDGESSYKLITIPEETNDYSGEAFRLDSYQGFNIKRLDSLTTKSGELRAPIDTVNLSAFSMAKVKTDGQSNEDILVNTERAYQLLKSLDEDIERDQVCFSRKESQIILLPKIRS